MLQKFYLKLYRHLHAMYGPQFWWPAQDPFEIMIGAILTQNTAWRNVEKAIINLKQNNCLSPHQLVNGEHAIISKYLRPAGYFNIKTKRIKNFCHWYLTQGGYDQLIKWKTPSLRKALLEINGIGHETADAILLYAFRRPVFVIDAYTRRLLQRLAKIQGQESYEELRFLFQNNLSRDPLLFNEYHALIVTHAKARCLKTKPRCIDCKLKKACSFFTRSHLKNHFH